ncbi:Cellulose synthase-like protein [Arachis hypogaea]|uniref:Cellulose synthase-like protein n=1 Tax=Arachis hypogaea TaxID=3818 RepID=A0A6B9VD09_ARAHY|nr:Cellulose synthase-like protein [Arachis hypogaea]
METMKYHRRQPSYPTLETSLDHLIAVAPSDPVPPSTPTRPLLLALQRVPPTSPVTASSLTPRFLSQCKYRDHCGRLLLPASFILCHPLEAVKIERVDLVAVTAAKPIPWSMSYWRKALPDEETLLLASCNYETNTKWGQEIGFLYGIVCEDIHTGFMLNCNG